jgi:lipoprotein-anchoring transpeptidase ErfK/SrfK
LRRTIPKSLKYLKEQRPSCQFAHDIVCISAEGALSSTSIELYPNYTNSKSGVTASVACSALIAGRSGGAFIVAWKRPNPVVWIELPIILLLLSGCAIKRPPVYIPPYEEAENGSWEQPAPTASQPPQGQPSTTSSKAKKDVSIVRRTITEKELRKLQDKDPDLDFYQCLAILSRLNKKDKEYIRADMKNKKPLKVPRDFSAYKEWSPLPRTITGIGKIPKFVLIVKDIPFLGWYSNGKLVNDTYVCVGKMRTWTKRGMYRVKEKDLNHMSDYPNAYGEPSSMPLAMKIYERVWIHAGDVIGPNCSHGCINVPLSHADKLYTWTDIGTVVMITESLKDLGSDMKAGLPAIPQPGAPAKPVQKGLPDKSSIRADGTVPSNQVNRNTATSRGGGGQ